ncbi:putative F420-dependent oxidoreductase [Murinocardiopsis flavida]|uniref:Putative F420-dependent oxidoreductase n=1 Tax=Murinocardiopsis flavida TaxID=645275 RepID=A0A2P8DUM2_9ACTN|nr:TIGR03619 family F420-dependent LLM class oxidoreductase [Murinocardiopsis flavida]PSL00913.1 putative F420-dependent oxidoreductase [Murinocardiopsis flavida]
MELHVVLPDESPAMDPGTLIGLGTAAERLGYAAAWLPDHLLPPVEYNDSYGGVYEPLVTLSYLAAATSTLRLGTSVLVLPMRSPFVVAKQAATLDRLSGGRFTLGVGVGWDRTEFASVGSDFATRGARTDEAITLLRHLFRGGGPFTGRYYGHDAGAFAPIPASGVPIMVGGMSDRALRRAAEHADEWQGVGLAPAEFARHVGRLRELTDRPLRVGARIAWRGGAAELAERVAEVHAFAEAGADSVAVWFGPEAGAHDRMAEFAEASRYAGAERGPTG